MVQAVFFDLDGTLTEVKSPWQHVHAALGLWEPEGLGHLRDWLAGRIDYATFFQRDVEMWLGLGRDALEGALDAIPLWPEAGLLLGELRARSVPAVIVSSGFRHVALRLSAATGFGFAEIHANEMEFDGTGSLTGVRMNVSGEAGDPRAKDAVLRGACARLGFDPAQTLAVGDSESDLPLFRAAGRSVCLNETDDFGAGALLAPGNLLGVVPYL
jgi:phosphoserine phosphatase